MGKNKSIIFQQSYGCFSFNNIGGILDMVIQNRKQISKIKILCIFVCMIFLAMPMVSVKDASAVIFASDTIDLYESGKRIKDNTVIRSEYEGAFNICENGTFNHSQIGPREMVFYKTATNNLTQQEWLDSPAGKGKSASAHEEEYLKNRTKNAVFSKKIKLPERTDNSSYDPPKEGMTGGRIGSVRDINIDIKTGKEVILKAPPTMKEVKASSLKNKSKNDLSDANKSESKSVFSRVKSFFSGGK